MNVAIWLERIARAYPTRPAILLGDHVLWTYEELDRRAASLGEALRRNFGVRTDDRVGVYMDNHPAYLEILLACWRIGAAAVPANARLHPKEAAWILANGGCKVAFVGDDGHLPSPDGSLHEIRAVNVKGAAYESLCAADTMARNPASRERDDIAWLFYTSGTTGRPKGVMITHGNLAAMTACYFTGVGAIRPEDHWLYAAPISHGAGLYGLPYILTGARNVVPASGGFDPAEIVGLSESLGGISFFAAPTMVKRLVAHAKVTGYDGHGLGTIVYGGGPMYVADIEDALRTLGPRFVQIYGQGESPMTITVLPRRAHEAGDTRLGSVGFAQALVEVRIARPDGSTAEDDEPGEVLVRGSTVMKGYWNDPDATADAIREGWLWTGDVGAVSEQGLLTLMDRSKDLIISGGTNVYPREIEELLLTHPGVAEVAVVGRPHPDWGEEIVAFVVAETDPGCSAAELDRLCLDRIARFKRPRVYRFVESLPKNNYGKVLKTELRRRLAEAVGPDV